ncbi:MAG TPA: beta-ketoacyl-[acyl-carrier-protein] synthase family protein [Thermomicrobiales bacterium]|nr:beta-ketoacyl-[acyl-carrier-protein] synthase family protein [Thermomicrobiales bacterium]
MERRVVITGLGVVAPTGIGKDAFWAAAREGRSGTGRPTRSDRPDLPVKVVGEVKDFEPTAYMPKKLVVRSDRNTHFAFAACAEALADAGIDPAQEDRARVGLVLASNYGGLGYSLEGLARLHQKGPSFVSAYLAIAFIPSAPVGQLSIFYGIGGYSKTLLNDAAGGADAIGAAYRAVRRGDADVIIAGGFEALLIEEAFALLALVPGACRDAPDPAAAFRPFNAERPGIVFGEGGAILILEELSRARARGAPIYGEVAGYGQTTDAVDLHHFAADGAQYARAFSLALSMGDLTPDDVGYVNADGRGTAAGDRAEARALRRVFGERLARTPVSAPKSMTGNALAGAGAIDAAYAALALRHGLIPPTINVSCQDPECDLRLVTDKPEAAALDVALLGARGAGGVNAALAFKRVGSRE